LRARIRRTRLHFESWSDWGCRFRNRSFSRETKPVITKSIAQRGSPNGKHN